MHALNSTVFTQSPSEAFRRFEVPLVGPGDAKFPAPRIESVWATMDAEDASSDNSQLAVYAAFALGGVVPALYLIL